jgi:mannose-6-phosphate isomerase
MLTETCLEREEPADLAPEAAGLARMLTPRYVAKPWGRRDGLPAPEGAQPLGEMIFEAPDAGLTIKWLQTSEPLSVQVHPQGAGRKHEWWHVTEALPGAYLDLGLEAPASRQAIAQAARDGTLPSLLRRIHPRAGDSFYIKAGRSMRSGPASPSSRSRSTAM